MRYLKPLMDQNFLEYASYVIKDRAIPDIEDGLKPVQRRILHSMNEIDDGKFNKVANIVGETMKLHPHGDAAASPCGCSFMVSPTIFATLLNLPSSISFIECRIRRCTGLRPSSMSGIARSLIT